MSTSRLSNSADSAFSSIRQLNFSQLSEMAHQLSTSVSSVSTSVNKVQSSVSSNSISIRSLSTFLSRLNFTLPQLFISISSLSTSVCQLSTSYQLYLSTCSGGLASRTGRVWAYHPHKYPHIISALQYDYVDIHAHMLHTANIYYFCVYIKFYHG